jgi:flagellar biosynthesis protein FliQ
LNELVIVGLARDALKTALYVAAPALIVSMVVGLAVSVFQVVTSLQDPTVAFVPKVLAVMLVVVLSFPWMLRVLGAFTTRMFTDFNVIVKQLP